MASIKANKKKNKSNARVKASVVTGGPSSSAIYQTRSQTRAMRPNINFLPNEVLAIILSKLDLKSQTKAESVCTLWRQIVKDMFATKRTLIISENESQTAMTEGMDCIFPCDYVSTSAPEQVIRKTIAQIVAKFPAIRSIEGIFHGTLKSNLIDTLCNGCVADIHNLYITQTMEEPLHITRSETQIVVKKFPNLQEFYIRSDYEIVISESAISVLLRGLPALKRFTLKEPAEIERRYRGTVFKHMNAGIQVIKTTAFLFNATAISRLGAKRPDQLRELNLKNFNPDCMPLIADNFPTLQILSINFWYTDYDQEVINLTQVLASISRLVQLRELSITAISDCTEIDVQDIESLKECPNLHTLTIRSAHMTDDSMKAMVDNIPGLRQLTLSIVTFESEDLMVVMAPIRGARHLRSLYLKQDKGLTDTLVEWLVTKCPQISFIDVMFGNLTIDAMMSCVRVCRQQPNRELRVVFDYYLEEDFEALNEEMPPNLTFEYEL